MKHDIIIKGVILSISNKQEKIYHFRLKCLSGSIIEVFTKHKIVSKLQIGNKIKIKGLFKKHPNYEHNYFEAYKIYKVKERN